MNGWVRFRVKHSLWFLFALLTGNLLIAQNTGQVSGSIRGADNKPAAGASVTMRNATDTSVFINTTSDEAGVFRFSDIKEGKWRLLISLVGFQPYQSVITVQKQSLVLEPVILQAAINSLQEVTVSAQKSFIEQKADRTVVNVNALPSNTGANVLEVLEKSPGISVDNNGTISYKGRSGLIVLIDDKPTYLSGDALASYLRSIPASQLDQIELIPNPPAKYDASGNAGMINIKTKKITVRGFNTNISASTGMSYVGYVRALESIVLNYRINKLNVFSNFSYGLQNNYRRLDVERLYFDPSGKLISGYHETAYFHPLMNNFNGRAGFDYAVTPKTSIGMVVSGALTDGSNPNHTYSRITNAAGALDSLIRANNLFDSRFSNRSVNLNMVQQFAQKGRTLSVDVDYLYYKQKTSQEFVNTTYDGKDSLTNADIITDQLPNDIRIWTARSDYTHPLTGKAKIEAGIKFGFVNTDASANYFNVFSGISHVDYDKTNRFLYRENVNAAYLSYSNEWKRFSLKTGLRMENTHVRAHQLGNMMRADSAFEQHYTSLFPTVFLSYKLDTAGSHTINLSYGRRIDRPYYQNLNPFVSYIDKYSTWVGNPFLRPQFATNLQAAYAYKSMFSITFTYGYTKDVQMEVDLQEGDKFVAHTYNLGHGINTSLSFFAGIPVTKWWNFQMNVDFIHSAYDGVVPGAHIKTSNNRIYNYSNNLFTMPHGWGAELSYFYSRGGVSGQFHPRPLGQVSTGVSKKILNNKGSLKLTIRDLFRINISGGDIANIPNVKATYRNDFANQTVQLGFTYSFGSETNINKKRETGSSDSEARRVGQ